MKYKADINRKAVKEKVEAVSMVTAEMKRFPTSALLDLEKLPDSLLQKLRKTIRDEGGIVRILKKPVLERVLAAAPALAKKVGVCNRPMALILTTLSPYELNRFFRENRKRRAAKVGDIAPFDIIVPEGDTDLPAGPALSELKSAGLNVMIKAGKIVISKDSTVAKTGEAITAPKAAALQKMNVLPFEVMASLKYGYDGRHVYTREVLDIDITLHSDLAASYMDALNLSLNSGVPTRANIDILLAEAFRQSVNMSLNGSLYSTSSIEQLLTSACRQGLALEGLGK